MKKRIVSIILLLCMVFSLSSCKQAETLSTDTLTVEHETKFGGVYLHITIEDFCGLGFEYGDSVDIKLSNGFILEDIPFYNGYYTRAGEPLLCAYPGYPYVDACYNNGESLYLAAGLDEDCTAVVYLHESGKYLAIQQVMSMTYTNERGDYSSDEVFANFRPMSGGGLAENLFYRAASPCDNQYQRAEYSSALCAEAGIGYILDLADAEEELKTYHDYSGIEFPYWLELYENGRVLALDMAANYRDHEFAERVARAMRAVIKEEGPFLIHCTEGKDRTGFVCLLVEALAGASLDELRTDYMTTYDNYYGVTAESDPEGYKAVTELKFDDMVLYLCDADSTDGLTPDKLVAGAEKYLTFGGMTDDEIVLLKNTVTGK